VSSDAAASFRRDQRKGTLIIPNQRSDFHGGSVPTHNGRVALCRRRGDGALAYCAGAGLSHAVLGARSHFFIQAQTLLGTRGPTTPFAVSMVPDRHFLVYSGPPGESSMCVEALVRPA
jgi:hypothetical protein